MIAEYQLVDSGSTLINAFNVEVKSVGTSLVDSTASIQSAKSQIQQLTLFLDTNIHDTESKSDYLGFKGSIETLTQQIDMSIAQIKQGGITDYVADYNQANEDYGFVRDNGTVLILSQLKYMGSVRDGIDRAYLLSLYSGLAFLLVLIAGCVFFVLRFANRLTRPIRNLTLAATQIAAGNMDFPIDQRVLGQSNEIGQLAAAFSDMEGKLNISRTELEKQLEDNKVKAFELAAQIDQTNDTKAAIMNILEDVDEEKNNAEKMVSERTKELREEKARLLASINALSFGFVLLDAEDHVLLKNPALATILDAQGEIVTMDDISEILRAPNSNIDLAIGPSCKRCVELKQPVEFKVVPYGKKFLRVICAPIIEASSAIGYIFIVEDITEAKVMERSRDEFFAVASHELRTPLTAIRGNADMILDMYADKIVDADMKEMLTDINSSSVRLINIVNDFLEVSRLEQGKLEVKTEVFDLIAIIEKVMRDLRTIVEGRGLSFNFTPPSAIPMVRADKARIEQILVNLVGNALKFTTKGSIAIEVSIVPVDFVKISIIDTGIGISEKNQSLLFRKFQQAGEQMLARDVTQGTGLGLYICSLLISRMSGAIGLERSELGKGSVFSFTVPIAR
jgi:signal transduction histidine kinase